jgi:predicted SAM-dependent methyltransferase
MKRIDFGCGASKKAGFIGVDTLNLPGVDVTHDLNSFPYPFESNYADEIWLDQVLEHLNNPLKVIEELYRIGKNGCKISIGVPYFRSFYSVIDPTHVNFFGVHWFNYFDPEHPLNQRYRYTDAKLKVNGIEFDREFKNGGISFIKKVFISFAEKHTNFYESKLSHLLPLNSLTFYLTVLK